MMASETLITDDVSTVSSKVLAPVTRTVVDAGPQCDLRTEQTPPQPTPDPVPQRMDEKLENDRGPLEEDEPVALKTGERPPTDSASENSSVVHPVS